MIYGGFMSIIRPSAELRNNYPELSKLTKQEQQPIYITVHGRGDTVLVDQLLYEQQMAELQLLRALAEGEKDLEDARLLTVQEVFQTLKQTINK
jgi:prevent-host-death family protein